MAGNPAESGGLLHSLRNLGNTLVALLQARLEIVSGEFEEQRLRFQQMVLLAVATGFCLAVAALLAVAFVVVLLWDAYRIAAIGPAETMAQALAIPGGAIDALQVAPSVSAEVEVRSELSVPAVSEPRSFLYASPIIEDGDGDRSD